jgi:uncharacterized protein (DUF2141 family)
MNTTRTLSRLLLATFLLAAASALSACSSSDKSPTAPGASLVNVTSADDGGLRLTVGTDKANYDLGETVMITTILTNTTKSPIALDFYRGTPARYSNINVNADDSDGVNHYAQGQGTDDKTTLGPGGSIDYTFAWDQISRRTRKPVDRGMFEIIGSVGFDDRDPLSARKLFVQLK